jgi:hypothetical protein
MKLRAQRCDYDMRVEFVMFERDERGVTYAAETVTQRKLDDNEMIPRLFNLSPTETQELMDNLWSCGFRPSEGTGSAGSLAATERHLEDMRRLVFEFEAPTKL